MSFEGQRSETFDLLAIGAVAIVLLIACANIGNLLLARAVARRSEIELCLVLGATRTRLVTQLVAESSVLALLAGAAGLLISRWLLDLLVAFLPADQLPVWLDLRLDVRTLTFLVAATAVAVLVFGLSPALAAVRRQFTIAGLHGGTHVTAGRERTRLRSAFVIAQVALSLSLLMGAGLILRSAHVAGRAEPGYDVEPVLTAVVPQPANGAAPPPGYIEEATRRLAALSGGAVAAASSAAAHRVGPNEAAGFPAVLAQGAEEGVAIELNAVTPAFFDVFGLRLLRGRTFDARDGVGAAPVAVLGRSTADRLFRDGDAVGRTILLGAGGETVEVIGVVGDRTWIARGRGSTGLVQPRFEMYVAAAQGAAGDITFLVRGEPATLHELGPLVRQELAALDPDRPAASVRPHADEVFANVRIIGWIGRLFGAFAAGALLLTSAGLAGVVSYNVVQRRRELAIRIALGATARDSVRVVLAESARMFSVGVLLGTIGALITGRLVSTMIYGITAFDPVTAAGVVTVLAASTALAAWLPARRAARADPMTTLRTD